MLQECPVRVNARVPSNGNGEETGLLQKPHSVP
jgi:hypothetical protein